MVNKLIGWGFLLLIIALILLGIAVLIQPDFKIEVLELLPKKR